MIQNVQKVTSPASYQDGLLTEKRSVGSLSTPDKGRCLTTFWDEIVKKTSLSDEFDVEAFFQIIRERLNSPEKEVRQHALRVLKDFIPVVNRHVLETNINSILEDVLNNLGHGAPSIRKSSIDCLYMYVKHSDDSDNALKNIVFTGMYKEPHGSHLKTNTVAGIIMALPNLILPHISQDTLYYVITALFNKLVQVTYQEVALKALLRTEAVLGKERFRSILNICGYDNREKDLDLLSEVYGINPETIREFQPDDEEDDDFDGILNDSVTLKEPVDDDVILEAEIKLDSGDAITMKVHEENYTLSSPTSESEDSKKEYNRKGSDVGDGTTDDEKKDYFPRSPRKVRFGGEVIKMRTPDSDGHSSENNSKKDASLNNNTKSSIPIRIRKSNSYQDIGENDNSISNDRPSLVEYKKSFIPIRKAAQGDKFDVIENMKPSKSFSIFPETDSHYSTNNFNRITGMDNAGIYGRNGRWNPKGINHDFRNGYGNNGLIQYDSHSVATNYNFLDNNFRVRGRGPGQYNAFNSRRGYSSASPISLIPVAGHRNRSNHSAPEIYNTSNQDDYIPQNTRFCDNNSAFLIENESKQETLPNNFSSGSSSKSPSNLSAESIAESNNRSNNSINKPTPTPVASVNASPKSTEIKIEDVTDTILISSEESDNVPDRNSVCGSTTPENIVINSPVTSQSTITEITSPSGSQTSLLDQRKATEMVSKNMNLSKSDSDLRYSSPLEVRTTTNSAPSTVKAMAFTPLKDHVVYSESPIELPNCNGANIASSLPDSLDANSISADPQTRPSKMIKNRTTVSSTRGKKLYKQKSVNLPKRQNLSTTMTQLESKDWDTTIKGLKAISILIKESPFQLNGHLHSVCVLLGKHIRSLRSQVARSACNATADLFMFPVKSLEVEVDDLAAALFHRTADTNKFLRSDAKNALDKMCSNLPPTRVIAVILNKGVCHHNPIVRCESARLLNQISQTLGHEKVFQLPKDTRDKLLKTAANFLGEGNYETRQHTQKLLLYLCQHKQFWKTVVSTLSPTHVRAIGNVVQKRLQNN
ncbi:uncharacterized protein LOC108741488 [Agrilus planipennis]|uniref:Uncharacterized protein LOC108741488 n=1 Tax=Agrilus planipennis TaxID=224129 RepID=A0A1W4XGA6_AGRPL|nr:uncharacterized protein LOC108741488 [Agrilus planipennis]